MIGYQKLSGGGYAYKGVAQHRGGSRVIKLFCILIVAVVT